MKIINVMIQEYPAEYGEHRVAVLLIVEGGQHVVGRNSRAPDGGN